MHRVTGWLQRGRSNVDLSTLDAVKEAQNLELALRAADLIMNDDIDGAEERLSHGNSAFHKLAKGTLGFLKATLSWEQDSMKEASEMLANAESSAALFHQKVTSEAAKSGTGIYDNGSAFALCQAEAQIMGAIVALINENITESLKGFYKMRKAYITLDSLAQMEAEYVKTRYNRGMAGSVNVSKESLRSANSASHNRGTTITPSALRNTATAPKESNDDDGDSDASDEFHEVDQQRDTSTVLNKYQGHVKAGASHGIEEKMQYLTVSNADTPGSKSVTPLPSGATTPLLPSGAVTPALDMPAGISSSLLTADADSEVFTNPLDIFIHSGVNLMSGLINLLLSVIPPAFGRLLSIIGFRGDREKGLRMLWQASKFPNINGGMAALIIFGWYNGIMGFCDIISDSDTSIPDDINGFPMERLYALLASMRQRYPGSVFWKLEEARTYSTRRQLDKSIEILSTTGKANLRQLEALHMFEISVDYMNAHHYEKCAQSYLLYCELNQWSQALNHYTAAAAYLQLYRNLKDTSTIEGQAQAQKYHDLAVKHFKEAPNYAGKKKMMGRQFPFDTFVLRKIQKWTERAAAWNCSFIDAVGVAPLEEMIMLWNGHKKMNEAQLNKSLANLAWSDERSAHWDKEELNEKIILATLRAIVYRNLRRHPEARALLQDQVLPHDASVYKGHLKDEWMGAIANYEMAANYWMERREYKRRYGTTVAGPDKDAGAAANIVLPDLQADAQTVAEARKYIDRAKNWGPFELDTRIGVKITAGHAAIGKWEAKHKHLLQ